MDNAKDLLGKVYSERLMAGQSELKPVFFKLDLLEGYINDPRYDFEFNDYSGSLSGGDSDDSYIYIQSFGLGYGEDDERLLAVFLCYLDSLSLHDQIYWSRYEYHRPARIAKPYYINLIAGGWEFPMSYYSAIIEEQLFINVLSKRIFDVELFRRTFEGSKRPREFNFLQMPTTRNYGDLMAILDNMLGQNINKKFLDYVFISKSLLKKEEHGTIQQLCAIFSSIYKFDSRYTFDDLFRTWRSVRKQRNERSIAHNITLQSVYNFELSKERDELVKNVYASLRQLRLVLQDHPKAASIELSERLRENIVEV